MHVDDLIMKDSSIKLFINNFQFVSFKQNLNSVFQ